MNCKMLQKLLQFIEQDILGLLSTEVPLLICNKNKCILFQVQETNLDTDMRH